MQSCHGVIWGGPPDLQMLEALCVPTPMQASSSQAPAERAIFFSKSEAAKLWPAGRPRAVTHSLLTTP